MIARPTGTHRRPPSTPRFHQIRRFVAEPHVLLHEMLREFGDFMCWRGFHDVYLVNHPEFIRPVLSQDYRHFSKHTIDYRVLARVMGNGLVSNDGPHWVRQRRLMQPLFSNRHVNGFDARINGLTASLMREWEMRAGSDILWVDREMSGLTFRIVGATLFGSDLEQHAGEVAEILEVVNLNAHEIRALMTLCSWIRHPTHEIERAVKRLDRIVYGMIERAAAVAWVTTISSII